jgi:ribosome-associated heat shock protein Hsp15
MSLGPVPARVFDYEQTAPAIARRPSAVGLGTCYECVVTTRTAPEAAAGVRLDVWLWATRWFKTRALSKQAVEAGKVLVDGQRPKPSKSLHAGERLRITRGEDTFEVDVFELCEQRGPATRARQCYRETDEGRAARELAAEQRRLAATGYRAPVGKPDKRARRLIRALGDIDAL